MASRKVWLTHPDQNTFFDWSVHFFSSSLTPSQGSSYPSTQCKGPVYTCIRMTSFCTVQVLIFLGFKFNLCGLCGGLIHKIIIFYVSCVKVIELANPLNQLNLPNYKNLTIKINHPHSILIPFFLHCTNNFHQLKTQGE